MRAERRLHLVGQRQAVLGDLLVEGKRLPAVGIDHLGAAAVDDHRLVDRGIVGRLVAAGLVRPVLSAGREGRGSDPVVEGSRGVATRADTVGGQAHRVHKGVERGLLRRSTVSSLAEASTSAWGLWPREAEVFAFAAVGLSLPSIASTLGLSVGTVRTQLGKAYAKSAVRSRAAATSALLDVVDSTALREASRRLVPGAEGPLTRREVAVLRVAATGRTTSAIASVIGISTETARTHLANAFRKLGVQNRSQALVFMGTTRVPVGGPDRTVEGT
jgi:DNA-binding CsgD family transcriptional regulator